MKFRLLCFGSHLLVSFIIALLSLWVVFWLWYPSPLDIALGVADIFLLLLCIDVIVGPLLTLLVAKKGKKTLKMDLFTIGTLQLIALSYGLYIVAQGRPVWMVYDNNRFEVVQAFEAVTQPDSSSHFQLRMTGAQWGAVIDSVPAPIARGDAYYQQQFLQAYDVVAINAGSRAIPIDVLKRFNDPAKVDELLRYYPEANGYIPMVAKEKALVVLVNKSVGEPIAIVDASPW